MQPISRSGPHVALPLSAPLSGRAAVDATATRPVRPAIQDAFLPPFSRPVAVANTPGAWRGAPDSPVGKAVTAMLARLSQFDHLELKGQTPREVFSNAILNNRKVTNEQLLAMTRISLEDVQDSPADAAKVLKKIPDARERTSHQFTVALMSAATGIDPKTLSETTPSLGMTGAVGTPLLYAPRTERMGRSTALHDFTDYLRGAGIEGLNRAVWGVENRILSAIKSAIGRWKY